MIRRPIRGSLAVIAASLLFLWPGLAAIAAEKGPSAPQSAPAPHVTKPIPLPEIATRTAETTNTLRKITAILPQSAAIQEIVTKLPELRRDIDRDLSGTTVMLHASPTLDAIQAKLRLWRGLETQANRWLKTLTARAVQLRNALDHLVESRTVWGITRESAVASNAPGPVLQQIDALIALIDASKTPLEAVHADVLDLQSQVAEEVARCESVMTQLSQAQDTAVSDVFTADSPPVWSPALWEEARKSLPDSLRRLMVSNWQEIGQYAWNGSRIAILHAAFFVATVVCFLAIRKKSHEWTRIEESVSSGVMVFELPWSAAYIVFLLVATGPLSPAPPIVQLLFSLASIPPMIRLVAPLGPRVLLLGWLAGILFVLEAVRQIVAGTPLLEQTFLVMEMLVGVAVLAWAHVKGHLEPLQVHPERPALERAVKLVGLLVLLGFPMGLLVSALGYLSLARIIASTALGIGVLVLLLTSCLRILVGLMAFSLRIWPLRCLKMVEHHRDMLVRRTHRVLLWVTIFTGFNRSLDHLGLLQPMLALTQTVLTTKLERGSISLSLGDVLVFLLTVWAAYLLSAFIRFALQEDVYPRLHIPLGLSYAASSLLNYVILALGVIAGMAAVGVDLTRVTVMAGALGVGIGFGLQSVVNNFVSGLILLFERPIHVGDSLEVGNLTGEVRRIGIRASTIRTRQGAEIIIPNAQLVTDKVTNWTLSDQLRRIDIPVGVNYGAPPRDVIQMLERVTRDHPRIMRHPPPHGLFVGFGDSSLNFELRAWTDEFADWASIRSDLAVAIHDGVAEAGWSIPFPQREVRILNKPDG